MKIKNIKINNYRSIQCLDFDISSFSVLVGANNSGKSNILRSLLFFFQGSEKISPEDVFSFCEDSEITVSVILHFDSLTNQEKTTFKKYLLSDESIKIGRFCDVKKQPDSKWNCLAPVYRGWLEEPEIWYLKESAFERLSTKDKRETELALFPELSFLLESNEKFSKERMNAFQKQFIQDHIGELKFVGLFEESPLFGRSTVAAGILPELIFVPAIRDLSDEIKITSKTLLGRLLLNVLDAMRENDVDFQKLISDVEASIDKLNNKEAFASPIGKLETELSEELSSWGVNTLINVTPPDITKLFELGTSLNIDDGVLTEAGSKGNGLQRAIIFSLFKVIARHNKDRSGEISSRVRSESQIYVIEEAELYLHPHKQREFYNNLKIISQDENTQVILTTHSSHFVRMDDYKNILLIRKSCKEVGTTNTQCYRDIFDPSVDEKQNYKLVHYINPDNGDMFFARKVILVEGESEKVVLPYLAERLGLFKPDVSIIECGSKHNIPMYIKLLNHFQIQYMVIYDEDPMNPSYDDPEKESAARKTFELNIFINEQIDNNIGIYNIVSPDFEGAFSISRKKGDKLGKGLAALKHFQEISNDAIPENMIKLLITAYS